MLEGCFRDTWEDTLEIRYVMYLPHPEVLFTDLLR